MKKVINISEAIEWSSEFETGIPRIDAEHRIFLELVNSYREALQQNANCDALIRIISEIEKYAQFHFTSEENLMISIGYPKYEAHRIIHYKILEGLNLSKHETDHPEKFLFFIYAWFVEHTTTEDKNINNFITDNQIQIPVY